MVAIRRIQPGEGDVLRQLRLAALEETPSAFSSTYADESARSSPEWDERAVAGAAGTERVTFLAFDAAQPIGIVGGFRSPRPDLAELVSMWTSPRFRRQGIGAALVHEVLAWAKAGGARTVELWVTEQRTEAVCFYRALGFVPTGDTAPLRPGSDEPVLRLSMPLDELA